MSGDATAAPIPDQRSALLAIEAAAALESGAPAVLFDRRVPGAVEKHCKNRQKKLSKPQHIVSALSHLLAYVDPGSGLLIWQAVVAAVIGVLFYLKKTRDLIIGLFRSLFDRDKKR